MKTKNLKSGATFALVMFGVSAGSTAFAQTADPVKDGAVQPASTAGQGDQKKGADQSGMDHSQMEQMDHSKMDHSQMEQMDHSGMDHSTMNHASDDKPQATTPAKDTAAGANPMSGMGQGMKMGPMQGGSPPPDARDPAAYGEGTTHAHMPGNEMNDETRFGRVLFDKLEYAKGDGEHGQNIDAEAWYGGDLDKVWLRAEGERRDGHLQTLRTEALWDHAIAAFWSTQLGVRHDTGGGDSRNWAAFGVRGLAPYWFDTTATAYWRSGGGVAARLDVRYELLFTQRLILEPEVEANLYSKADPARGLGSGLSDLQLALRLRYEIRRQFAPYVGVTLSRDFGDTANYAKVRGERSKSFQVVGGVRVWF